MHLREICIPEKGASFFFSDASKDANLPGQKKSGLNIKWWDIRNTRFLAPCPKLAENILPTIEAACNALLSHYNFQFKIKEKQLQVISFS